MTSRPIQYFRDSSTADVAAQILQTLPLGVCQFDSDDRIRFCNSYFQRTHELPGEAVAEGVTFFELVEAIPRSSTQDILLMAYDTRGGMSQKYRSEIDDGHASLIACEELPSGGIVIASELEKRSDTAFASLDSLTGLPDRNAFKWALTKHVESAVNEWQEVAVLFFDLDRFKPVNDALGHTVGDQVLKEVADRIKRRLASEDVVARLGGDEFAVIQTSSSQPHGSRRLADQLINSISQPFGVADHTISIGLSVGIAIAPFDGQSSTDILKNADLAMYRAKRDGRNTVRFFEPEMEERMQVRRLMERELEQALARGQFQVRYQPVMDVREKRIVSVEALLRWQHPEFGFVSPAEFIPLAEETGQIAAVGEWVLKKACEDAATWDHEIGVAVNVSPVQLKNRSFAATVAQALQASGLPAHRLELEITETALITETELTVAILTELRQIGTKIAMDDFGTGYSSINHLRQFPFDKIKIDRSFVTGADTNPEAAALVKMIAALGICLAVTTTAEGVETESEFDIVREAGCSQIQGYLLSKPITNEKLSSVVTQVNT